jgi:hypothetical protein
MVVEDGMSLGQVDDKSSIIFFLKYYLRWIVF